MIILGFWGNALPSVHAYPHPEIICPQVGALPSHAFTSPRSSSESEATFISRQRHCGRPLDFDSQTITRTTHTAAMMELPMAMPGTFSFDSEDDFGRRVAKPSFHIPPSPASSVLSRSISRNLSNSSLHCRKRPRIDASNDSGATPRGFRRNDISTTSFSFDAPSPAPLVNTEYRIAGGLDTPTAELVRQEEQAQLDFEQDLRPSRYTFAPHQQAQDYFPQTPVSTKFESRKRKLPISPKSPKSGWGRTVWTFTGGMAGKVIDFCWNTAFHGFHAGAGQGYHMQIDTPTVTAQHNTELRGNEDVFDADYRGRGSTPIPGNSLKKPSLKTTCQDHKPINRVKHPHSTIAPGPDPL